MAVSLLATDDNPMEPTAFELFVTHPLRAIAMVFMFIGSALIAVVWINFVIAIFARLLGPNPKDIETRRLQFIIRIATVSLIGCGLALVFMIPDLIAQPSIALGFLFPALLDLYPIATPPDMAAAE